MLVGSPQNVDKTHDGLREIVSTTIQDDTAQKEEPRADEACARGAVKDLGGSVKLNQTSRDAVQPRRKNRGSVAQPLRRGFSRCGEVPMGLVLWGFRQGIRLIAKPKP